MAKKKPSKSLKKSPPPKKAPSKKASSKSKPPIKSPPKKVPSKKISSKSKPVIKSSSKKAPVKNSQLKSPMKAVNKASSKNTGSSKKAAEKTQANLKKKNYSEIDRDLFDQINQDKKISLHDVEDQLELTEDEAKKAMKRLESKGKIKVHTVMDKGKWITEAEIVDNYGIEMKKNKVTKSVWDTQADCPCFTCPSVKRCSEGQEMFNPKNCEHLTKWLECQLIKAPFNCPFKANFEAESK